MSFRRMVVSLTFLAIFAMAMRVSVANDTWWHLRAGDWMLEHRQLIDSDRFSLTRLGEPWIYPGWLSQLLMVGIYRGLGLPGLNLLTALAVVAAFAFIWRTSREPPLFKAFVFVLGATVSGVYWSARPQILSFMMAGAFWWSLHRAQRRGPRSLWLPVALMAVWANLHGGFAIGFILLAISLAASVLDRRLPEPLQLAGATRSKLQPAQLGLAGLACGLAVSLNPHGPRMLIYPFQTISIATLQNYIQEWQSPNFHQVELQPFLLMLLLTAGAMALSPKRPTWRALLTYGVFAAMALMAGRHVALFGLLVTPVLSRSAHIVFGAQFLDRSANGRWPSRSARTLNLALVVLLAGAAALKSIAPLTSSVNQSAVRRQVPVEAVEYLAAHGPPGAVFNSYNWGSYLLWKLHPDYLSFVDGRTDLFDDEILNEYLSIWRAENGWESRLRAWGIRLALIEPNAPLAHQLQAAGWATLFEDDKSIVLARDE